MAEKLDFKKFYEDSKPSADNIHFLGIHVSYLKKDDKKSRMAFSNTAFGMLAHLNITSNDVTPLISANLVKYGVKDVDVIINFISYLEQLKIYKNFEINPTAIPIIQKYRAAFDKYEAQLGIQNPFTKKEGKEPGDN